LDLSKGYIIWTCSGLEFLWQQGPDMLVLLFTLWKSIRWTFIRLYLYLLICVRLSLFQW